MTKYLLVPDSFKVTMSYMDVIIIMNKTIRKHDKEAQIHSIPVADGEKVALILFSML